MTGTDDEMENDADFDKFAHDYERHQQHIFELLSDYLEAEELDEEYAAHLLLDMAVRMRMTAYGIGVASPSAAGLKLDLDRFRREVDDFLREAKKGAEAYIRELKAARAQLEAEAETDKDSH